MGAYLDQWCSDVLPYSGVTQSTVDKYTWVCRHWLTPKIGTVRLDRLAPSHVQSMLRDLERQGLSPRTRQQARTVLRRALSYAQRTDLIGRNAAALTEAPRATRRPSDALTADEANAVLRAAEGDRLEALAVLALKLGMRRGECLGIDWADVDFGPTPTITVTVAKTSASRRQLPLIGDTAETLRAHRQRQLEERVKLGPQWRAGDAVFTTEGGLRLGGRQALKVWHRWTEAAGIGRRRFHASRHTAATLMLQRGIPSRTCSSVLGHASLSITSDIYAEVGPDALRRALIALDEAEQ